MAFSKIIGMRKSKLTSISICLSIMLTVIPGTALADEPTKLLKGDTNANFVLNNIDYFDIRGMQPWSAPAIYETGALDIMKGYGSQIFAKDDVVSREQALAIALRIGGREADAKKAAEQLDAARSTAAKIKDPLLYWSLGYLKIAADEGMISASEFKTARDTNGQGGFDGQSAAQRQEMAYWIAKALKLNPQYNEQAILNNFNDWRQCDPDKIAYIEATLQSRIMNGDGGGSFLPKGSLTREQAAQIGKNAESYVLPAMLLTKATGTIEKLVPSTNVQNGKKLNSVDFYVRNIDGSLSSITSSFSANPWDNSQGELNGSPQDVNGTDLVVYKNGSIGGAGLLASGDRVEYIYDPNGIVKYVNVVSSNADTQYLVGQLKSIDTANSTASFNTFFKSETPNVDLVQQYGDLNSPFSVKQSYPYSKGAAFIADGIVVSPTQLKANDLVVVTVVNDVITRIQKFNPVYKPGSTGIINGTVQDNNPSMGYITLYSQEGTGVGVNPITSDILRNYNYVSLNGVEVNKDHQKADTKDIIPGDTVFLKLDSNGKVTQISAASNYIIKYGTVLNVKGNSLVLRTDDGSEQSLNIDQDTKWYGTDGSYGIENIKPGDSIMLTLGISPSGTKVFEVRSSNIYSPVKNVYKASLETYKGGSGDIYLSDVKTLGKSSFDWTPDMGIKKLSLSDGCKIYVDGVQTSRDKLSNVKPDSMVYAVTKSDFGDQEKAIALSINTQQAANMPIYNDSLMKLDTLNNSLTLKNTQISLPYRDETIFIRDGRVVSFNNLNADDALSVASGYYKGINGGYAAVVVAGDPVNSDYFEIYRGKISQIDDGTSFGLKSYSQLEGYDFNFHNTPKSFDITSKTRLIGDSGLISMRDFTTSGSSSYYDKNVYVIAKDGAALLISTAPYANMFNYKADVVKVDGTTIELTNGRIYNTSTYEWSPGTVNSVNVLSNTIILKGDKIIKQDELVKGDKIKLFKEGNTAAGNAYIIVVEG